MKQDIGILNDFLATDVQSNQQYKADILIAIEQVATEPQRFFGNVYELEISPQGAKITNLYDEKRLIKLSLLELKRSLIS